MKINLVFTEKESIAMGNLMAKFDFEKKLKMDTLTRKYKEANSAGKFEYSGLCKGEKCTTTIDFEAHEKLMLSAIGVYKKYADTMNSIFCTVKSLALSCKSLINNFNIDYRKELNNAFAEIEAEEKAEKAARKAKVEAEFKARKEALEKKIKKQFEDDGELY